MRSGKDGEKSLKSVFGSHYKALEHHGSECHWFWPAVEGPWGLLSETVMWWEMCACKIYLETAWSLAWEGKEKSLKRSSLSDFAVIQRDNESLNLSGRGGICERHSEVSNHFSNHHKDDAVLSVSSLSISLMLKVPGSKVALLIAWARFFTLNTSKYSQRGPEFPRNTQSAQVIYQTDRIKYSNKIKSKWLTKEPCWLETATSHKGIHLIENEVHKFMCWFGIFL